MPKATSIQNSLTSGEWSPKGAGRTDLQKYASGAKKLENFLINQLGGASFRPGTRYIAETVHSAASEDKKSRLIPFQYQADSDYVIEMGEDYFKLYENDSDAVVDTAADTFTKLLLHANGLDGSFEIQDSGNTGHIITQVGATTVLSLAQAKFGICSLSLDGDSDSITAPTHADWNIGGTKEQNYTIDFWVKHDVVNGDEYYVGQHHAANDYWAIWYEHGTNKLGFKLWEGGLEFAIQSAANTYPDDSDWHHIALIKTWTDPSCRYSLYVDGTRVATGEEDTEVSNFADALEIGIFNGGGWFDGHIDEVRVIKSNPFGAATLATITTPTAAHSSDANTKLLLHMESRDTSSTTAPKIPDFIGTAQLDTAAGKFKDLTGYTATRASILLDGGSDWIQVPDSADWNFGTGDFTVEGFFMFAGIAAQQNIMGQYEDATNYWFAEITAANKLQMKFVDGGVTKGDYITDAAIAGLAINTYYHFAFVRNGATAYIFVDGTAVDITATTAFTTKDVGDMAEDLKIGAYGADAGEGRFFNGWMDEVRITKGLARFTATFTSTVAEYALTPITTTQVTTTYDEDEIFDIQYAQNNDILYLVHPDHAPRKLSRTSATAFSIADVDFVRGPLLDTNTAATTITPSGDTGDDITLTASVATFLATNVGSWFRVKSGMVKITAFTSTTVVTGDVDAEPDGTAGDLNTGPAATTDWAEGAFSDRRGWPSAVAFHEQRLYYANTAHEPQKIWASYISAYDSFDITATTDNYSITFEVATEQRNAIKWMSSGNKKLVLGTTGGTFSASSSNSLESIAPDNIVVTRDTNYGVAGLMPKRISSYLYYIQRDLNRLRELSYSFQVDNTISSDMTLLAEHILKDGDGVVDIDHQQSPNDRIFCVRDDGEMSVLTRNAEQDVMGWSRFVAGADAKGDGLFETVCVIPKSETDDQVWVIVKRNINGTVKRFIEFFMTEDFDENWDAIRCDSSLTLDSPSTITGVTIASDLILYTAGTVALAIGDQIKINGVVGTTDINGTYKVSATSFTIGTSFKITTLADVAIDFAAYGAWISGGEIRKMVTAISGLDHLVGETVRVQADGYIPSTETFVVQAGGSITLPAKAAVVHAGLPYDGTIQMLKLSEGSPTGTGQTRMRRIFEGTLRLDRSQGLSVGRGETALESLTYDDDVLFTGDKEGRFETTWDRSDELIIRQNKALPANILAIVLRSDVSEG